MHFKDSTFVGCCPVLCGKLLSDPETKQLICTEFHFKHKVAQQKHPKQHCAYNASTGEVEDVGPVGLIGRKDEPR